MNGFTMAARFDGDGDMAPGIDGLRSGAEIRTYLSDALLHANRQMTAQFICHHVSVTLQLIASLMLLP